MAAQKSMNIWEWTDDRTNWTKFLPSDIDKVEGGYQQTQTGSLKDGFVEMGQMSWNTAADKTRYRFDFKKMSQVNLSTKKERGIRRRTNVPCCPKMHELTYLADTPKEYASRGLIAVCDDCSNPVSTQGYYHCTVPKCEFDRCMACQGEKIQVKSYSSMADWQNAFAGLSAAQLNAMTKDVSSSAELRKENLSIVWRTWADVARTYESEDGQNTTDMTFFAIAPAATRPKGVPYSTLPDSSFVPFPAVRSPNYFDTIDVLPNTDALSFMAKNRAGVASRVTLSQFLATIGSYIADLEPRESWADAIDSTPLQLGSQFSILPVPTGRADIGVAAFGRGNVNLHIIVGPGGDIGWAPEVPGFGKRIYFKSGDGKQLKAISLVPEARTDVKKAFFKVEVHQESVAEEKERYQDTKNRLLHLQIEMAGLPGAIPGGPTPLTTTGRRDAGEIRKNCGHQLVAFSTPHEGSHTCDSCMRSFPKGTRLNGCRPCDFDLCDQCLQVSSSPQRPQQQQQQQRQRNERASSRSRSRSRGGKDEGKNRDRRSSFQGATPTMNSLSLLDKEENTPLRFDEPMCELEMPCEPQFEEGSMGALEPCEDWDMADAPAKAAPTSIYKRKDSKKKKRKESADNSNAKPVASSSEELRSALDSSLDALECRAEALESQSTNFLAQKPAAPPSFFSSLSFGFKKEASSPPPSAPCASPPPPPMSFGSKPASPPLSAPMGAAAYAPPSSAPSPITRMPLSGGARGGGRGGGPSPVLRKMKAEEDSSRMKRQGLAVTLGKSKKEAEKARVQSEDEDDDEAGDDLFGSPEAAAPPKKAEVKEMDAGIQLAEVAVGDALGSAQTGDMVPMKASGKERASRKAGVAVRASWLYYGVTGDGAVDAERLRRFVKQMLFERREKQLQHGSLVSGFGSWGGPENAPIKLFGLRLTDAVDTTPKTMGIPPVKGIRAMPLVGLKEACVPLKGVVSGVDGAVTTALQRARAVGKATIEHTAAVYLYTMASDFYRNLNAALRDPDRKKLQPYYSYLRLLAEAMVMLPNQGKITLWRGVALDLEKDHSLGTEVTWWGVSSCTPKLSVAQGFLGSAGPRTLFSVNSSAAVPIQELSAFKGEEEYILAPGTRLRVESINREAGGLLKIALGELPPPRHVD